MLSFPRAPDLVDQRTRSPESGHCFPELKQDKTQIKHKITLKLRKLLIINNTHTIINTHIIQIHLPKRKAVSDTNQQAQYLNIMLIEVSFPLITQLLSGNNKNSCKILPAFLKCTLRLSKKFNQAFVDTLYSPSSYVDFYSDCYHLIFHFTWENYMAWLIALINFI